MLRPGMCGPNASCVETPKKVVAKWFYHQCVCNPGFVGNGITCIAASDLTNGKDNFFSKANNSFDSRFHNGASRYHKMG